MQNLSLDKSQEINIETTNLENYLIQEFEDLNLFFLNLESFAQEDSNIDINNWQQQINQLPNEILSSTKVAIVSEQFFGNTNTDYALEAQTLYINEQLLQKTSLSEIITMIETQLNNNQSSLESDTQNRTPISLNVGSFESHLDNHIHDNNCNCEACFYPLADDEDESNQAEVASNNPTLETTIDNSNIFKLHSNPTANHTIYLDFDGHYSPNSTWEDNNSLRLRAYSTDSDANNFSDSELNNIQKMWRRVAEDFAPFNINVTTEEPTDLNDLKRTSYNDPTWGIRVAITKNLNLDTNQNIQNAGGGGTAYYNSFNWGSDEVALVFNSSAYAGGETISHEVGHALNLRHDGQNSSQYYAGHTRGETSWAPIMGAGFIGYDENVTQWSRGSSYYGGTENQDDLDVIANGNGFSYREDDHGDANNSATDLVLNSDRTFGIIERNDDLDVFKFTVGAGVISLNITSASRAYITNGNNYDTEYFTSYGSNLDIWAGIYDDSDSLVAQSNPTDYLWAEFTDLSLDSGTYYLKIDGVGTGNPLSSNPSGYSDYGSLGQYIINNTFEPTELIEPPTEPPIEPPTEPTEPPTEPTEPTLPPNTLIGTSGDDSLTGNDESQKIEGLAGKDTLVGNGGDDTLDGGTQVDRLIGGNGNDTYYVDQ